ncbi:MAG: hypothetical protein ABI874_02180, partial [Chloroflexota bacterium]
MDIYQHLVDTNLSRIADGWHRRETLAQYETRLDVFGYPFVLRSNTPDVIALAQLSAQRFSQCAPVPDAPVGRIDLFTVGEDAPTNLTPLQLENQFQTVASGSRGLIQLGGWGSIYADWDAPSAFGFIAPALLQFPSIASRHCLDTFMLVALLRRPLGMLHASGLVKDGRVVLLIGPHGMGKSTTALHLIRAGYRLISDTLIFTRIVSAELQILGYAVGEVKLTADGRALFPELPAETSDLSIDGRRKPIFDLRDLMPNCVESAAVTPRSVALCLTRRSADAHTHLLPLDEDITLHQIIRDTSYLDEPHVMAQNLAVLDQLIQRARNFILELGSDPHELVAIIEAI